MAAPARSPIYAHLLNSNIRAQEHVWKRTVFWTGRGILAGAQVGIFFSLLWLMLDMWATPIDGCSISHPDTRAAASGTLCVVGGAYLQCFQTSLLFFQRRLSLPLVHSGQGHARVGQGGHRTGERACPGPSNRNKRRPFHSSVTNDLSI